MHCKLRRTTCIIFMASLATVHLFVQRLKQIWFKAFVPDFVRVIFVCIYLISIYNRNDTQKAQTEIAEAIIFELTRRHEFIIWIFMRLARTQQRTNWVKIWVTPFDRSRKRDHTARFDSTGLNWTPLIRKCSEFCDWPKIPDQIWFSPVVSSF